MRLNPRVVIGCIALGLCAGWASAETRDCRALENSAFAEPEWYLEECLGGVRPPQTEVTVPAQPPGDLQFIVNVRGLTFLSAPLETLTYTNLGAAPANSFFAVDFDNPATTLWGINNTTRGYGTINQTNGTFTQVGLVTGIPAADNISGMEFDPTSSTVFLSTTTGTNSFLWTFNTATGVATLVGTITGFALVIDIAVSPTGVIFGHDIGTDQIMTINRTTAAPTLVGSTLQNANFAQGMDFDFASGILYAWVYIGGGVDNLSRVNTTTGATTIVANGVNEEIEGSIRVPTPVELMHFGVS